MEEHLYYGGPTIILEKIVSERNFGNVSGLSIFFSKPLIFKFGDRRVRRALKAKVKAFGHEFDSRYLHHGPIAQLVRAFA